MRIASILNKNRLIAGLRASSSVFHEFSALDRIACGLLRWCEALLLLNQELILNFMQRGLENYKHCD